MGSLREDFHRPKTLKLIARPICHHHAAGGTPRECALLASPRGTRGMVSETTSSSRGFLRSNSPAFCRAVLSVAYTNTEQGYDLHIFKLYFVFVFFSKQKFKKEGSCMRYPNLATLPPSSAPFLSAPPRPAPHPPGGLRTVRQQPGRLSSSTRKMAGSEVGVIVGQPHLSHQDLATLVRLSSGRKQSEFEGGNDRASREAMERRNTGLSGV